ncbi:membrane protein containing DUF307 [gut metagenome]|uniref:Membrane protein containing DUF307 n=1 Tax=gut metagenome TaxID=749906 RepID=J9CW35_9ZZZZ
MVVAVEYALSSLILMLTVVGIPFGLQTMKLAVLSLWPFGKKVVYSNSPDGCLSLGMNILWILVGGFSICLTHLALGLFLCITIVGIPFGMQHFKMASLALTPFGKDIVDDVA